MASTTPAMMALQQSTRTVPVVFVNVADPVGAGFVESLARPGVNRAAATKAGWLETQVAAFGRQQKVTL